MLYMYIVCLGRLKTELDILNVIYHSEMFTNTGQTGKKEWQRTDLCLGFNSGSMTGIPVHMRKNGEADFCLDMWLICSGLCTGIQVICKFNPGFQLVFVEHLTVM